MEAWEVRYEHERDVLIAICKMRGIEFPELEYGFLPVIPGLLRKFDGEKFWENMKELGHTSAEFGKCECRKC